MSLSFREGVWRVGLYFRGNYEDFIGWVFVRMWSILRREGPV